MLEKIIKTFSYRTLQLAIFLLTIPTLFIAAILAAPIWMLTNIQPDNVIRGTVDIIGMLSESIDVEVDYLWALKTGPLAPMIEVYFEQRRADLGT